MSKMSAPIAVALVTAGCAATSPAPNAATGVVPTEAAAEADTAPATEADAAPTTQADAAPTTQTDATAVAEVDIAEINRMRCEPVTRTGTRIVIAERCYPVGRASVDEEGLSEQLEQVRRDQEELDRRRREAEARRGPGL